MTLPDSLTVLRTITPDGCWIWTGRVNNCGYGVVRHEGQNVLVHRLAYQLERGPIPADKVLDHLCGNRPCFNPDDLEPVTQRENSLRSPLTLASINAAKTTCPQGHPYDEANTRVYRRPAPRTTVERSCRACARDRYAPRQEAQVSS